MPKASRDHQGNVVYLGTLTKTFAPTLRIGFMVAPENFIGYAAQLRKTVDGQGDRFLEAAIAQLYRDGNLGRHINKAVQLYRGRRDNFCRLLENNLGEYVAFDIPDGGMSVWVRFRQGTDLGELSTWGQKGAFGSRTEGNMMAAVCVATPCGWDSPVWIWSNRKWPGISWPHSRASAPDHSCLTKARNFSLTSSRI
jgi:hypothetical protein